MHWTLLCLYCYTQPLLSHTRQAHPYNLYPASLSPTALKAPSVWTGSNTQAEPCRSFYKSFYQTPSLFSIHIHWIETPSNLTTKQLTKTEAHGRANSIHPLYFSLESAFWHSAPCMRSSSRYPQCHAFDLMILQQIVWFTLKAYKSKSRNYWRCGSVCLTLEV